MPFDLNWALGWVWIGVAILWVVAAFGNKPVAKREAGPSRLLQLVFMILAAELLVRPNRWNFWPVLRERLLPETPIVGWISLAVTCAGMAFAIWARFYLGREWSGTVTVKQGHELKCGGPYAHVRHPIYTGLTLAALGTAIGVGEVRAFVAVPLILAGWWIKAGVEERFMVEQFGEQYERYRSEVKGLIPFVW